jgi:hypothetical protein
MSLDLGTLQTVVGKVPVVHRLALAVVPVDAITQRAVAAGLRVDVEPLAPPALLAQGWPNRAPQSMRNGAAHVVLHTATVPQLPGAALTVRITDPAATFVARRLRVPLWTLADVTGADTVPPASAYIPSLRRQISPWLLPGPAFPLPGGITAIRVRVLRTGEPVRWARVEAWDAAGARVAWAHGDEHGQALLILDGLAAPSNPFTPVGLAVRLHVPPAPLPATTLADLEYDPFADLPVELIARSPLAPAPPVEGDDVSIGVAVPAGYLTSTQDELIDAVVGTVTPQHDIEFR